MALAILPLASLSISVLAFSSVTPSAGPPYVSEEMQRPEFWVARILERSSVIMGPEGIARLNGEIIRRGFRVRPTFEHYRVPRGNTVRALNKHLESLTHWIKYDRDNNRLRDPAFSRRMAALVAIEDVPETIGVRYGLAIRRTRVRLMPTDMLLQRKPNEPQFDVLQLSVIDIGQPVGLYHLSRDGEWGAVQTPICFGWIWLSDVGWAAGKKQVEDFIEGVPPVMALSHSVTVFSDSSLSVVLTHLGMGNWLPLEGRTPGAYCVRIPERSQAGELRFGRAFIPVSRDVSEGYLGLTDEAIIHAAFRQLGNPYGWGGTAVGTDCSRFIANVFSVFGIELPRTSFLQIESLSVRAVPAKVAERKEFIESLPPARTLLQFPGHIGLYLGTVNGRHYMIHSLSAYRVPAEGKDVEVRADRVLVSDLSLGQGSRKGSLLENLEKAAILR